MPAGYGFDLQPFEDIMVDTSPATPIEPSHPYEMTTMFESRGQPGSISRDGKSYGSYQMYTRGQLPYFVKQYGKRFGYSGQKIGGTAFQKWWREASQAPEFATAETEFMHKAVFKPALDYAQQKGLDISNPGIVRTVADMATQHGQYRKIINSAARSLGVSPPTGAQIDALWNAREDYLRHLPNMSPILKKNILRDRFAKGRLIAQSVSSPVVIGAAEASELRGPNNVGGETNMANDWWDKLGKASQRIPSILKGAALGEVVAGPIGGTAGAQLAQTPAILRSAANVARGAVTNYGQAVRDLRGPNALTNLSSEMVSGYESPLLMGPATPVASALAQAKQVRAATPPPAATPIPTTPTTTPAVTPTPLESPIPPTIRESYVQTMSPELFQPRSPEMAKIDELVNMAMDALRPGGRPATANFFTAIGNTIQGLLGQYSAPAEAEARRATARQTGMQGPTMYQFPSGLETQSALYDPSTNALVPVARGTPPSIYGTQAKTTPYETLLSKLMEITFPMVAMGTLSAQDAKTKIDELLAAYYPDSARPSPINPR